MEITELITRIVDMPKESKLEGIQLFQELRQLESLDPYIRDMLFALSVLLLEEL